MSLEIEILERRHNGAYIAGPLEDLSSEDFDFLKSIRGCSTEILPGNRHFDRVSVPRSDHLNYLTYRILAVDHPLLLATALKGLLKKNPHLKQIYAWLSQGGPSDRSEFWIKIVERPDEREEDLIGPPCLEGETLFEALQKVSARCEEIPQVNPREVFDFESNIDYSQPEIELVEEITTPQPLLLDDQQGYLLPESLGSADLEEDSPILEMAEPLDDSELEAVLDSFFSQGIVEQDTIWLEEMA